MTEKNPNPDRPTIKLSDVFWRLVGIALALVVVGAIVQPSGILAAIWGWAFGLVLLAILALVTTVSVALLAGALRGADRRRPDVPESPNPRRDASRPEKTEAMSADEVDIDYECGECGHLFNVRQARTESDHLLAVVHCPVCVSPDNIVPRKDDSVTETPERDIWVGSTYAQSSPKILVLGESIYEGDDEPLRTYVPNWVHGRANNNFLTRIFNGFAGKDRWHCGPDELWDFWNKIILYNFVTSPLSSSKARPGQSHWSAGSNPLKDVLLEFAPDGVLVVGKQQADHSVPIIRTLGIKHLVVSHPRSGVSNAELRAAWLELERLMSARS